MVNNFSAASPMGRMGGGIGMPVVGGGASLNNSFKSEAQGITEIVRHFTLFIPTLRIYTVTYTVLYMIYNCLFSYNDDGDIVEWSCYIQTFRYCVLSIPIIPTHPVYTVPLYCI